MKQPGGLNDDHNDFTHIKSDSNRKLITDKPVKKGRRLDGEPPLAKQGTIDQMNNLEIKRESTRDLDKLTSSAPEKLIQEESKKEKTNMSLI